MSTSTRRDCLHRPPAPDGHYDDWAVRARSAAGGSSLGGGVRPRGARREAVGDQPEAALWVGGRHRRRRWRLRIRTRRCRPSHAAATHECGPSAPRAKRRTAPVDAQTATSCSVRSQCRHRPREVRGTDGLVPRGAAAGLRRERRRRWPWEWWGEAPRRDVWCLVSPTTFSSRAR